MSVLGPGFARYVGERHEAASKLVERHAHADGDPSCASYRSPSAPRLARTRTS